MPNQFSLKDYYSKPQPTQTQFANDIYGSAAQTQTETLPNGGGTYNPTGGAAIFPTKPVVPSIPENDLYAKYRDPKTGDVMTHQEYAIYLGNKVPKGTGQISNYAGDSVTNPNRTANELIGTATDLNNARNDIAVGASDPYKVGNKSGIAYSPAELKAIESAYAGIYDPALKDVFSRLRDKQADDKEIADREESDRARRFSTDESIRLYNATTALNKGGGDEDSGHDFSNAQISTGVTNSGLSFDLFNAIKSDDVKNWYINPPMVTVKVPDEYNIMHDKKVPMYEDFNNRVKEIEDGTLDKNEFIDVIESSSSMTESIKMWLLTRIYQIPQEVKEEKESIPLWKGVLNEFKSSK